MEWIPVSERLPKKNVEVLATTEWGAVTIAEMYSANDWFIHEGTTNAETDEIVAWMPLPDAYCPEEKCAVCVETGTKWCSDCTENGGRYNYFKVR